MTKNIINIFNNSTNFENLSQFLKEIKNEMKINEISDFVQDEIILKVKNRFLKIKNKIDPNISRSVLYKMLNDAVCERLKILEKNKDFNIFKTKDNKKILICLFGLSGSGKTSVAVKLANISQKIYNKKTVIVNLNEFKNSTDSFLSNLTKEINVNSYSLNLDSLYLDSNIKFLERVYNKNDILILDFDTILYSGDVFLEKLKSKIKIDFNIMILDAMSSSNTIDNLSNFDNLNGLIITKVDSTKNANLFFKITEFFNVPIFYISCGEHVDNILNFEADKFSRKITGFFEDLSVKDIIANFENEFQKNDSTFNKFLKDVKIIRDINSFFKDKFQFSKIFLHSKDLDFLRNKINKIEIKKQKKEAELTFLEDIFEIRKKDFLVKNDVKI